MTEMENLVTSLGNWAVEANVCPYVPAGDDEGRDKRTRGNRVFWIEQHRLSLPRIFAGLKGAGGAECLERDLNALLLKLQKLHVPPVAWPMSDKQARLAKSLNLDIRKLIGRLERMVMSLTPPAP